MNLLASVMLAALAGPAIAQASTGTDPTKVDYLPDPRAELPVERTSATIRDGFTLVAAGDLLYGRPMLPAADDGFLSLLAMVRSSDFAFANLEGTLFDRKTLPLYPREGDLLVGRPEVAEDIKAMGFSLVSKANNHSDDWGRDGLRANEAILDHIGLPYAGAGPNRAAAREATFVDTRKGRVAVVATTSTFSPNASAEDQVGDVPARPGVSTLRTRQIYLVTADEMQTLRRLATKFACALCKTAPQGSTVQIGEQFYRVADRDGMTYEANPFDESEILRAIRGAKQEADLVLFSVHAHESSIGVDDNNPAPGDFLPNLFHLAVDAGADVVVAHGPHALRGIEIYKGQPIFYGVGSFIFQGTTEAGQDTLERLRVDPRFATHFDYKLRNFHNPDLWYQGLLVKIVFAHGQPVEVRLYPVDTGVHSPGKMLGMPRLADSVAAAKAFDRVRAASAPFGTRILVENGIGVIRLAADERH